MKPFLLITLVTASYLAPAQNFSVSGQLVDSLNNPLPAATVLILNAADSSLVNFSLAGNDGYFTLKNLKGKEYILKASFVGYLPYVVLIQTPEDGAVLDVGKIYMEPALNKLDAIEIASDAPPVTVKKDTIEFNAGSFNTRQNAMVEDLLKKLPGVEVDHDGNITAQGEQVKSVMVDGKKFFGNDPKLATRNLPADAVEKVQVFDKASDRATFTGIDDGQREKTINLKLKAERRNAIFGNMMAGAGTKDRLMSSASVNKFTKGSQLSFLGMGNNVNQSGFGIGEYMNFTGGSRQMRGGRGVRMRANGENSLGVPLDLGSRANGLMSTYAGGVNVNHELNNNTEVNGSYFYSYLNHDRDQTTVRENFLKDSTFTFNERSQENNTNSNHRANATLDHKIDSLNTLRFTTNFSLSETDSEQFSTSENITPDGSVASRNERRYSSTGLNTTFNSNLLYRHRFPKKGRSLSATLSLGVNENEMSGTLDAINSFYQDENLEEEITQTNDQLTEYLSYGATISYTEPVGKRKYLELNYNFRENRNDVARDAYDISNGEASFNEVLSNRFNSHYQYHRGGLNFRIAHSDYNFVAGASLQQTNLAGEQHLLNSEIDRGFTNVLPSARFNYDFSSTKHLGFNYRTSVREPDILQLQPVIDNSDPLNQYTGNPGLRPSYSQSWRLNYTAFNPANFMSFFVFTGVDYTTNAIINAQHIDERLVRTITPVNVSSNLSINTNVNIGIPVKKLASRFNVSGRFRNVNSIAVLNDQENDIIQQSLGGSFRYNYQYKEILDLTLSANLNHQQTRYAFDQPDQEYINSTYAAECSITFLTHYALNLDFNYLMYENKSEHFDRQIPLLDLSLSRFLLKNKSGEIKIGVNNLLDKALGIDQTANINYLERVITNSPGRYFFVSFTYALNKQLNPMESRRDRPRMRIRRR